MGPSASGKSSRRNPQIDTLAYFTDVLGRVNTHPQSRRQELLPNRWRDIQIETGRHVVRTKRPEWREEGGLYLIAA